MNPALNLLKLAWIQLVRHRVRSLLTILGVASGMFLFTAVETLQRSLGESHRSLGRGHHARRLSAEPLLSLRQPFARTLRR